MIKAVLFDFFGVLTEGGREGAIRGVFAKAYKVDPETLRFEDIGLEALKGFVDDGQFIEIMNQNHPNSTPVSPLQFQQTVDGLAPSSPVYEVAAALRAHGIQTAIMSNVLQLAADRLRLHGLYDGFDPVLLSCDLHMAKPEVAMYELALERLDCAATEVLFIDDQEVFLQPARSIGMHTILASSPQQIVGDTRALLLKQNNLALQ